MSLEPAKAKFKLIGNVSLYSFPAHFTYEDVLALRRAGDLDKYLIERDDNLVVDAGLQQVLEYLIGNSPTAPTHNSVGSGTNNPAAGDTNLQTSIARLTITNKYRVSLTAYYDTFWSTADGAGTWAETGIHNASSGGTMLCRKKFSSTFTKSSGNTALVAWSITAAAV